MKKILFIMKSYPAHRSANVKCDERVISALKENGSWDISCLVSRFYNEKQNETVEGVHVHRIDLGLFWNTLTWAYDNQEKWYGRLVLKINRLLLRIKQIIFIPIYPIYEPSLAIKYIRAVDQQYGIHGYDLVVFDYGGYETMLATYELKKNNPNVLTAGIFWDPLVGKTSEKYLPSHYTKMRTKEIAKKCWSLNDANFLMEYSRESVEKEITIEPQYHIHFSNLPGIYQYKTSKRNNTNFFVNGMINIVYSGSLSIPDRDPTLIIDLISRISSFDRVRLIFLTSGSGMSILRKLQEKYRNIVISNYVPEEELEDIYMNADILLNIGNSIYYNMLPSKLFRYISSGKPIISTFTTSEDVTRRYLKKYPLAIELDLNQSIDVLIYELENFFTHSIGRKVDFETINELYSEYSPNSYLEAFEKIIEVNHE